MPEALQQALDADPAARAIYDGFAFTHRRKYAEWIAEAKREDTRRAPRGQGTGDDPTATAVLLTPSSAARGTPLRRTYLPSGARSCALLPATHASLKDGRDRDRVNDERDEEQADAEPASGTPTPKGQADGHQRHGEDQHRPEVPEGSFAWRELGSQFPADAQQAVAPPHRQ